MTRRTIGFLITFSLGILTAPLATEAQPVGKVYHVGLLGLGSGPTWRIQWQPFLEAMRELHYIEGRNLVIQLAFADGKAERLPALVADLVRAQVDVIVTTGTRETLAAKQATASIPIVMLLVPDPVAQGLVASLARPGGNITGLTSLVPGLSQKYVELLREVLPSASRFAVVVGPPNPVPEQRRELEEAGRALGVTVSVVQVSGPDDFADVLARAKQDGAAGIIATSDPVTFLHRSAFVHLALQHRLPGIYWTREYVAEGGLMTYSASLADLRRRAAPYVDKILRGASPAELPIEQPTRFELVINLKTAKALGLTISPTLLFQADEVIQ
jgi:putative tryptophan/tyrosine transport system substrate-binding protein